MQRQYTDIGADLPERLAAVLAVIYLIHTVGADDPERAELRSEAMRLATTLSELMPDEEEAAGLVALLFLDNARQPARYINGEIVVLRDQDRTRWDRSMIATGQAIVLRCIERDRPGPYQIQAAIQAVHGDAATFEETDWSQIVTLYNQLLAITPAPVVRMNRAIAIGERDGPQAALDELDGLGPDLERYHLYHAARAHQLRRLGVPDEADAAQAEAMRLAPSERERTLLERTRSPE